MKSPPACPSCGSPMKLRIARKGQHAGEKFWGCSNYPGCKEILGLDGTTSPQAQTPKATLDQGGPKDTLGTDSRIVWNDRTSSDEWTRLYTHSGGQLRSTNLLSLLPPDVRRAATYRFEQTFLAIRERAYEAKAANESVQLVLGTLRKILQRGDSPFLDPETERQLLKRAGISEIEPSVDPGDLTFELKDTSVLPSEQDLILAAIWSAPDYHLDKSLVLDSQEERLLVENVIRSCGPQSARWLVPQASLDSLLRSRGRETQGNRRLDFLFTAPWRSPLVIEIDGLQHRESSESDQARDEALKKIGFQVERIPAEEVRSSEGSKFNRLLDQLKVPLVGQPSDHALMLLYGPLLFTQFSLALFEALERGWLDGRGGWHIEVRDPLELTPLFCRPLLELIAAIDELWGGRLLASKVTFYVNSEIFCYERRGICSYSQVNTTKQNIEPQLQILLEPDKNPFDSLPKTSSVHQIVTRCCTLPVRLADRRFEGRPVDIVDDSKVFEQALRKILRFVFAKKEFREGQLHALRQILKGKDCAVLLPTGAGKSLIYQLAGLLMPGRTLIIDPIVALMEDQVRSLYSHGITRAVEVTRYTTQMGKIRQTLDSVRRGDSLYCFIAPERLQQREFRDALRTLVVGTPINLVVIDEAHCVSEWGHDFRTAYLNVGPTIKNLCTDPKSGEPPPILALTGTASRAVLRDVLLELQIEHTDPEALVKPHSFDRPELTFDVIRTKPEGAHATLLGYLQALPQRFGVPFSRFFSEHGRRSFLGIIFCPWVNGTFGIKEVAEQLQQLQLTQRPGMFSGKAPRGFNAQLYEREKRSQAEAFKRGELPMMVATKAFGMGIDIPNVRYVVHFGIPGSIEGYYQEAGRAGRDRQRAVCSIVFTESSPEVSAKLLSENADGGTARELFLSHDIPPSEKDDVLRQLWFHFDSFPGISEEMPVVEKVLSLLGWDGMRKTIKVPFGEGADIEAARERAIYRLSLVGVIEDYLKDWGSKVFEVITASATNRSMNKAFLGYVERAQPSRLAEFTRIVTSLKEQHIRQHALALTQIALEFHYDTIERSRRRALREMWLLARDSQSDAVIRNRIEDYFHEGDLAPNVQELVDKKVLKLHDWYSLLSELTIQDAGELRGTTARFLESYPDHPGLLVGRAVSELLVLDNHKEYGENLRQAVSLGSERYSIPMEELGDMIRWLIALARRINSSWAVEPWIAWEDLDYQSNPFREDEKDALLSKEQNAGEAMVVLNRRLREIVHVSQRLATQFAVGGSL